MVVPPARVLLVVAPVGYMEDELDIPRQILEQAGFETFVASTDRQRATGSRGGTVRPDLLLSEVDPGRFEAVVFVGGLGAAVLLDHPLAIHLAARAAARGLVLGGICFGAAVLAAGGCLRGKRATTYPPAAPHLASGGATYTGKGIEIDGRVVTAAGPEDARSFGRALADLLRGKVLDPSALVP